MYGKNKEKTSYIEKYFCFTGAKIAPLGFKFGLYFYTNMFH